MGDSMKVKIKAPAGKPIKVTVTPMARRKQLTDSLAKQRI